MLEGVSAERIQQMSSYELRLLDNIKKGFYESDEELLAGKAEDRCLEELFKAMDTAKTLRRSLLGKDISPSHNSKRFIEFIYLEVPRPEANGLKVELIHARTGKKKIYGFGELVYEIRCMTHENENLNHAEEPNYHILLDWGTSDASVVVRISNGRAIVSGHFLWNRLRQILSKFITLVDSIHKFPQTGRVGARVDAPLNSIRSNRQDAT